MISTMKNGGKRFASLLLLALVCVNILLPVVPAEAGIMNKQIWYIQMSVDTSAWALAGGVVTESVGRLGGTSLEGKRLTSSELSDVLSNPTSLINEATLTTEREENNDNKSNLALSYPTDISAFTANSATLKDQDSANTVLSSMLYDFNNAFSSIYNTRDINDLADYANKVNALVSAVEGGGPGGPLNCDSGTGYDSVSIGAADLSNIPAGMSASNYRKFTFTKSGGGTESVHYCVSVPKDVPESTSGITITWGTLAAEAFINYACGVDASQVYSSVGFFEEQMVNFLGSIIDWAGNGLGLWSLDELMFNNGIRGGSSYAYGIFPVAWQSTVWTFFFIAELVAVAMLLFCIINNVVRRALSTVNPVSRATAMSQIMDILKVVALLIMFPFLLQIGMGLSSSLAKLFGATAGGESAKSAFDSLRQGTNGIGGCIVALLYLGALIYFNAYYFMRSIIVSFLIILGPLAIAMIGINEEYKKYFKQWSAGIISYIAIQPIHSVILAVLLLLPSTGRSIEKIVAVYAMIPIGKMARGMILPDGGFDIASGAGDQMKQRAAATGQAALNVGANAIAMAAGIGMARDQEKLRQQEQQQQEQERQAADGGVGNNFNQNKYDPNRQTSGQGDSQSEGTNPQGTPADSNQQGTNPQESGQQGDGTEQDPLSTAALQNGAGEVLEEGERERVPAGENGTPSEPPGRNVESSQRQVSERQAGGQDGVPGDAGGSPQQPARTQENAQEGVPGESNPEDQGGHTGEANPLQGTPPEEPSTGAETLGNTMAEGSEELPSHEDTPPEDDKDKKPFPDDMTVGKFMHEKLDQGINGLKTGTSNLIKGSKADQAVQAVRGFAKNLKEGHTPTQSTLNAMKGESEAQRKFDQRHQEREERKQEKEEKKNTPKRIAARNMRRAAATFAVGGALSIASGGRAGSGLLFMSQRSAATAASLGERAKAFDARQEQINSKFKENAAAQQQAQTETQAAEQTALDQTRIPTRDFASSNPDEGRTRLHDPTEGLVSDPNAKDVRKNKEQAQAYGIQEMDVDPRKGGELDTNANLPLDQKQNLSEMAKIFESGTEEEKTALREAGYQHVSSYPGTEDFHVKLNSNYTKGAGGGVGATLSGQISADRKTGRMDVKGYTQGAPLFQSVDSCKQAYSQNIARQPATLNTVPSKEKGVSVDYNKDSGSRTITYNSSNGSFQNITDAGSFTQAKNETLTVPTGVAESGGVPTTKQAEAFTATFTPAVKDSPAAKNMDMAARTFEKAKAEPENVQAQQDAQYLIDSGIYNVERTGDGGYIYSHSHQFDGGMSIRASDDGKQIIAEHVGSDSTISKSPIIPNFSSTADYKPYAEAKTRSANRSGYAMRQNGGGSSGTHSSSHSGGSGGSGSGGGSSSDPLSKDPINNPQQPDPQGGQGGQNGQKNKGRH